MLQGGLDDTDSIFPSRYLRNKRLLKGGEPNSKGEKQKVLEKSGVLKLGVVGPVSPTETEEG